MRFLGGTDDYSLKNVLAAEAADVPVGAFVDSHARRFEDLSGPLDLSFDDFIRTSADPRHIPAVHRLWNAAMENGDLYTRQYEGDYCVGCERFYTHDELDDGRCPEHLRPVEHIQVEVDVDVGDPPVQRGECRHQRAEGAPLRDELG